MGICGYCKNESELTRDVCSCTQGVMIALDNWFEVQEEEELQTESFFKYRKDFEESLKLILGKEKWERKRGVLKGLDLEKSYEILNDKKGGCDPNFLGENSSIREVFLKFRKLLCCYLPYASSNGEIFLSVEPDTVPNLEVRASKSYQIVKAFQFIIENSKSLRTGQAIELKEKFKKGKKKSVQKIAGELQARDIETEKLRLEKELEESKLREQQATKRAELEIKKNDVHKKIAKLTLEEEEKLDRISDSAKIKKFLSNALTSRIINKVSNCVMDRGGAIYVEEVDWIKEEEICGVYGVDLFLPTDYQKIKNAFLTEIKNSPKNWELVWGDRGITDVKERGKPRKHNWSGFKFTWQEERDIRTTILEQVERERAEERQRGERNTTHPRERQDPTNIETEQVRAQGENREETGTENALLSEENAFFLLKIIFFIAYCCLFIWLIIHTFKVANIIKKGTERNKTLAIFLGTDQNSLKLIVFDYQPTKEEQKIFISRVLTNEFSVSKLENNVLKARDLLALVKYYESEGRIKKYSQINELLLVKLENFRLAENSTSESKAYLSVNINGRVDKIIEELTHLKRTRMFEPIFW